MHFALLILFVAAAAAEECNQACQMNYVPICGTDGHTYSNPCQLESSNCLKKTDVVVAYSGECVEASCNIACHFNYDPVCGTDGQTYGNACELETVACLKKTNIAVAHSGECIDPKASCNMACHFDYNPVCGTDGQTYGNVCELETVSCMKKSDIAVAYSGVCTEASCKIACHFDYNPVCGTDGVTYGNACELETASCMKKSDIAVAYSGVCSKPSRKVCNVACLRNWEPVCGTDGITYGNRCQLDSFACQKNLNLAIDHAGEC